jgi:hypothetical protein
MAYNITNDISRMIVAGQKEIFTKNFENYPLEYPSFTTEKTANKKTETYDSMGNLKGAEVKVEGDSINYGKVDQAYQTSITNVTIANGYAVSLEAMKYDLYNVVNSIKAKELARTMRVKEEQTAIYWVDNATTTNLADGVPLASNSHPLVNSASLNDTLATTASIGTPSNHQEMLNMFYDFKNHQGAPIKCTPKKGLTHASNMFKVKEVYDSILKAGTEYNDKNVLPSIQWTYSTYMSSKTAHMLWDTDYEWLIMQWFMKTDMDQDEDKINTKNLYMNAVAMYNSGCLVPMGFVFNVGS